MSVTDPPGDAVRPEPLYLESRESAAKVNRLFEEFQARQAHALAVLDDPGLTRFERAALATKVLQVLAGYRGRKPRDGDAGRPAIPAVTVEVMARRATDIRTVVNVDGPAAGLTDLQVKHEVAKHLDLSWERLRQILTGQLGTGALRRRAKSDRPAGRPPRTAPLAAKPAPEPREPAPVPQVEPVVADAPPPQVAAEQAPPKRDTLRDALAGRELP